MLPADRGITKCDRAFLRREQPEENTRLIKPSIAATSAKGRPVFAFFNRLTIHLSGRLTSTSSHGHNPTRARVEERRSMHTRVWLSAAMAALGAAMLVAAAYAGPAASKPGGGSSSG